MAAGSDYSMPVLTNPRLAQNDAEHVKFSSKYVWWQEELQRQLADYIRNPNASNEAKLRIQLQGYRESFLSGQHWCPTAKHD